MEESHKELQLLSTPHTAPSSSARPPYSSRKIRSTDRFQGPSTLDLQLSISVSPFEPPSESVLIRKVNQKSISSRVEALKWHAAEQIRLAAMEEAYAERLREHTRKEMELAQSEFARARSLWERAREEVERAEKMKETATQRLDSTSMEITCQSCRQMFQS
ncbi:protein indeterminate-domain 16-like [Olea europaea var. sylvestris]|uniref:protein indeterminate-domain 16-like n=1 Tax=Olea europaea var. sylvestris TaxID=158386 RepID=UPI000C1D1E54|nr:protein indeterminate-domain 16-like [Olea europaea var. sylvestris]